MPPVADVERGISKNEVSTQIGVLVFGEGVTRFVAQVEVDAAYGEVHRCQSPSGGIRFLPEDSHITQLATVGLNKLFRLHKHTTRTAARVIHFAVVWREYRD